MDQNSQKSEKTKDSVFARNITSVSGLSCCWCSESSLPFLFKIIFYKLYSVQSVYDHILLSWQSNKKGFSHCDGISIFQVLKPQII